MSYIKIAIAFLAFLFTQSFFSCKRPMPGKAEIIGMNRSGNVDSIMLACELIYESKDSTLIPELFYDIYDPRASMSFRHKGMTVNEVKVWTLGRISGISPPRRIDSNINLNYVEFYRKIFKVDSF